MQPCVQGPVEQKITKLLKLRSLRTTCLRGIDAIVRHVDATSYSPHQLSRLDARYNNCQHASSAVAQTLPDGRKMSGYFVSSFTFAEITTMRATQPLTFRDQSYNGLYQCAVDASLSMQPPQHMNIC